MDKFYIFRQNQPNRKNIMRTIKLPKLEFSRWYSWDNRENYPLKKYPGVYAIAITSDESIEGKPINYKDISYIGMTNSKDGLSGRWDQFFYSIKGKSGHSGGKRIYKDKGHYNDWKEILFVAAMGIKCNVNEPTETDYIKMGWVAFFEYEAFAEFYTMVGGHPRYNEK